MGPRKKQKTDSDADRAQPAGEEQGNPEAPPAQTQGGPGPSEAPEPAALVKADIPSAEDGQAKPSSGVEADRASVKSWKTGTWSSKAAPVAQIARESITAARGATSELVGVGARRIASSSPSRYLSGSIRRARPVPLAASTTKLNVTSSNSTETRSNLEGLDGAKETGTDASARPDSSETASVREAGENPGSEPEQGKGQRAAPKQQSFGWYGWWSKPDNEAVTEKAKVSDVPAQDPDPVNTPLPTTPPIGSSNEAVDPIAEGQKQSVEASKDIVAAGNLDSGTQSRSWFWSWSSLQNARGTPSGGVEPLQQVFQQPTDDKIKTQSKSEDGKAKAKPENESKASGRAPTSKASGWAFWSEDKPGKDPVPEAGSPHKQVGELAVADTPSQSHPEAAQFNEQQEPPKKDEVKSSAGGTKGKGAPANASAAQQPAVIDSKARKALEADAAKPTQSRPNILLPTFKNTYPVAQTPSYWDQVRRWFLGPEQHPNHLAIAPKPPRLKKALAIGVHGFFPSPLVQKVIGQPTGTSIRFANAAAMAIKHWTDRHGNPCAIEKVALEGEGTIADRVDTLWKLLLNWIDHIKNSDFIFVACHSQGVPVAILLLAKLIQFGCVGNARIGVCAMAGINLGPFAEYRSRIFGATAFELFDFSRPDSVVSRTYLKALEEVLQYGVRISYVGSIDDQLVSLESSTFSNISHPYIYRAVWIDGRTHTSDFIAHLVGFVLKLRNLGISDHGLIRELSPALAGSIYTGDGHSRIHDDPSVYGLALEHALETTHLTTNVPLTVTPYEGPVSAGQSNPYFLPWAMRGILEEDFVRKELQHETKELLGMFEEWKPVSKGLKDVRWRLEAVKSKL